MKEPGYLEKPKGYTSIFDILDEHHQNKSIAAREKTEPCKWHITYNDVINIKEATNDQM